jgi:miniconductance mechanosensitive channel
MKNSVSDTTNISRQIGHNIVDNIDHMVGQIGLEGNSSLIVRNILLFIGVIIVSWLADYLVKKILISTITVAVRKSKTKWDDILLQRKFFNRIAHFAPALIFYFAVNYLLFDYESWAKLLHAIVYSYMVILALRVIDSFLYSANTIYMGLPVAKDRPIKGYIQTLQIILYLVGAIMIFSIVFEKDPSYFLTGLGAMMAVLLIVFKDPILGFVASIQLSANNMVRLGDWVEMPKYGADGDVIEMNLTTIKVQNWDKTISTIPPYAFVSESFKNWRGMQESGGRRIKRPIYIDVNSIKFCDEEMLNRFSKIRYISEYIDKKKNELADYNQQQEVDNTDLVNQRRMTNVGTFRAYIVQYLKNHPKINQNMTFLVRQLQPGETGLPIEIYVFTNDIVWANYEGIQADIFDHLLAILREFDLNVYQNPTGLDFRNLRES